MIKNKYTVLELICVAVLIGFVIALFVSRAAGGTEKRIKEIAPGVLKVADISEMNKKSAAFAAKTFGFDTEKEEGILYYKNDNIMNVSELLIIKLKDEKDAETFKNQIKEHVDNQMALFKNYAPDQYSLLENSIIEVSGNTVFYCTAPNAPEVYEAFKQSLK